MALHKGSEGTVKIADSSPAVTIAEIKGWSYDTTANTIDTTELGDTWMTKVSGTQSWSGSIDCYWDETDTTGQGALSVGASVVVSFYPEGAASGDTYSEGTAIVTGVSLSGSVDSIIEASYSLEGAGALTEATV